jgi:hypothetical protein
VVVQFAKSWRELEDFVLDLQFIKITLTDNPRRFKVGEYVNKR